MRGFAKRVVTAIAVLGGVTAIASSSTYNDMGSMAGQTTGFWNTTGYAGISVDSAASASIAVDTHTWSQAVSSPPISINTKPYVGFRLILK